MLSDCQNKLAVIIDPLTFVRWGKGGVYCFGESSGFNKAFAKINLLLIVFSVALNNQGEQQQPDTKKAIQLCFALKSW